MPNGFAQLCGLMSNKAGYTVARGWAGADHLGRSSEVKEIKSQKKESVNDQPTNRRTKQVVELRARD